MQITTHDAGRRSRRLRRAAAVAVAAATSVTLAACASSGNGAGGGSGGSSSDYHVGASLILSGPAAAYGANMSGGMLSYFKDVNAHGGVNGKQITMDEADGGLTPATTIQSYKQLVEQNHDLVVGGLLSTSANAGAASVISSLKTTALFGVGVDNLVRPQTSEYFYDGGGPLFGDEAFGEAEFMQSQVVKKANPRVAVITFLSAENQTWQKNIATLAAKDKWNIVDTETYPSGATSFGSQAAKLAAAKPDYIIASFDDSSFAFVKALQAAGVKVPIVSSEGGPNAQQMKQLNYPDLSVLRYTAYPVGTSSAVTSYLADVKKYGGKADPQSHITQYGYLQAKIIVAALTKCGKDCTPATFATAMGSLGSVDTGGFTFGPVTYSKQSAQGLDTAKIYTWDATKQQVVLNPTAYKYPS